MQAQTAIDHVRRYESLDVLRMMAALGIVAYHCDIYAHVMGWQDHPYLPNTLRLLVDLFFVLSGFIQTHVYGTSIVTRADYKEFLQRRLARIYPLHALMVVCFVALSYGAAGTLMARRIAPVLDPGSASANLLLLQSVNVVPSLSLDFPSWSISAEWFLYVAFPVLSLIVSRIGGIFGLMLAVTIAIAVGYGRDLAGLRDWTAATFDFGVLRALPSFIAGIAVYHLVAVIRRARFVWPIVCLVGMTIAYLMLARTPATGILPLLPIFVGCVAIADRDGNRSAWRTILTRCADPSYSVYLLHALVMIVAAELIDGLSLAKANAGIELLAVTILLTVCLSIPVYRFYERPMRKMLRSSGLRDRRDPEHAVVGAAGDASTDPGQYKIARTQRDTFVGLDHAVST